MSQPRKTKTRFDHIDHNTWQWKLFLLYDMLMMLLIIIDIFSLALQAILLSDFATWIANFFHLSAYIEHYATEWNSTISNINFYFICYLVVELLVRWLIAIYYKHHHRWWFFPFIHWYEVLSILPQLRFLRLLRAGIIAYRLHELGYPIIPATLLQRGKFYYNVLMEELTDRVILTAIRQFEKELESSHIHQQIIHQLIDHHREQFAVVCAETLQQSLTSVLLQQQPLISQNIGHIVNQSLQNTPELTQLVRLLPIVGNKIELQIQAIGQRLGENISAGIIAPFTQQPTSMQQVANPLFTEISQQLSQVPLNSEKIDALVASIVTESLAAIKQQVSIKQWQVAMEETNTRQNKQ